MELPNIKSIEEPIHRCNKNVQLGKVKYLKFHKSIPTESCFYLKKFGRGKWIMKYFLESKLSSVGKDKKQANNRSKIRRNVKILIIIDLEELR